jgi:hypothetical protein
VALQKLEPGLRADDPMPELRVVLAQHGDVHERGRQHGRSEQQRRQVAALPQQHHDHHAQQQGEHHQCLGAQHRGGQQGQ